MCINMRPLSRNLDRGIILILAFNDFIAYDADHPIVKEIGLEDVYLYETYS